MPVGVAAGTVAGMVERVEAWWARRQFSRGVEVPYPVGTYRDAWAPFPMLVRQYHPELNAGITLSQIPPAAEVLLLWQCESGHQFVATPAEQRHRPEGRRRRSGWCPSCASLAVPPGMSQTRSAGGKRMPRTRQPRELCPKTPGLAPGEPFVSECAPAPASAAEARLRAGLFARLELTVGHNAVRTRRPFFSHEEVWPDILLSELRIAVEYDSTGRFGLEHVGRREEADLRKDRLLRASGWEVVRIRTGKLEKIGPYDLQLSSTGRRGIDHVIDTLREIRGPLLVDAYLR